MTLHDTQLAKPVPPGSSVPLRETPDGVPPQSDITSDSAQRFLSAFLIRMIFDAIGHDLMVPTRHRETTIQSARDWLTQGNDQLFFAACAASNRDPDQIRAWAKTQDALGWPKPDLPKRPRRFTGHNQTRKAA